METHENFGVISNGQKGKLLAAYVKYTKYGDELQRKQAAGNQIKIDANRVHQERKKMIEEIKKCLSGPHHPCKNALHDFLYFLKVSTQDLEATCDVLGPMILIPADPDAFGDRIKIFKNRSKKLRESCARLLKIMVENQDSIFAHTRQRQFEDDFDKNTNLSLQETEAARMNRLKHHLRHFFEIRDPLCVGIVEPLFEYFNFDDIARCIYTKYRMLPFGWKEELEKYLTSAIPASFEQFMPQPKEKKKEKKENYGVVEGSYYDAEKEADKKSTSMRETQNLVAGGLSFDPRVPFNWFKQLSNSKKIKYLTEKTLNWPETMAVKVYAPYDKDAPEVEKIVDEFIDNQGKLLATLKAFHNFYVTEIMAIARGDVGESAQRNLRIDAHNARLIFKQNLKEVIAAQERFVTALEPLQLMKTAKIKAQYEDIGRAGIMFKQFLTCQKVLTTGYQHYNVNYQTKIDKLKTIQDELEATASPGTQEPFQRTKSNMFRSSKKHKNLNFLELWEELSATKAALTNKQLGSVLILPIQAVPRYNLFFERIIKKAGPNYLGKPLGDEAMKVAEAISTAVNENIKKSKEVVDKLLGQGTKH